MYGLYNGYGGWSNMMGFWGGGIMMFLFLGAFIYFFVWLVRNNKTNIGTNSKKALDILKERYVKGEITKEQFEIMKKDIS